MEQISYSFLHPDRKIDAYVEFHSCCFLLYSDLEYLTLAGLPITTESAAMFLVTTEPMAITAFRPV
jgi:hypothetical protein